MQYIYKKKVFELINEFSKNAGYKVIYKIQLNLYMSNKESETEILKSNVQYKTNEMLRNKFGERCARPIY